MSKIRHLCLGVSALSLLILGTFSVQLDAFASTTSCRNPHQIVEGENLSVIAAQYNVTVDELVEENGITDPNIIVIGQTICIPNGAKKSSSNSNNGGGQAPRYNDGWGNYGVPGESYDPATINQGGGGSPEYSAPQQQSYGQPQENYAPQQDSYGPQQQSYGPSQESYAPQQESYSPQQQKYSSYDGYGVPGKAYDPVIVYAPQPQPQPTRSTADRESDPTPTPMPTPSPTPDTDE